MNSPADLKSLNDNELTQLCAEIREYMVECCATNPGHIGSSLGAVEIAVAVHKVFDTPDDKVIWDVGHQAYAHKIITGRREQFRHNREKGGLSGFPKIDESPYDSFGAGHASNSISAALGMAIASEKQGIKRHHIAIIGDGSLTGGLAFEGLNNAGSLKTDLMVILNDNNMSIDGSIGALHNHLIKVTTSSSYNKIRDDIWNKLGENTFRSRLQRFVRWNKGLFMKTSRFYNLFDSLGFRYYGPIDGNDLSQLIPILERLKNMDGPKLLHVVTKKGKGYKPAEENPNIWHAPGKYDPATGEILPIPDAPAKYQDVFGHTVTELAETNDKIVGISPAMLSGSSLNIMQEKFPERVFDVGIAEGHAVTFSAGLAAEGMLPFCNIYSSFMQRAYDNVIHDVALQKLKVIFCLDRGGLVGEDGATHQGVFDLSAFRPIPDIAIASPLNELELRNMLYSATGKDYPAVMIRYPRGRGVGVKWQGEKFSHIPLGKALLLNEGSSVAVLSIGPVGNKCAEAVAKARENGVNALHYDMRFLKPIDTEAIDHAASVAETIITVEDGAVIGGLHGAVSEYVAEKGLKVSVAGLGVPDLFIGQGTPEQLYTECGFNTSQIVEVIMTKAKNN
ncbi:MAG: 1-deoxy-D-xylulose-5-phosphate synthase [Bacteroidales bacterium]|nr:1-deoxy-D-xylulose-5-phosphate synthase [Bacteroidales bacterium]